MKRIENNFYLLFYCGFGPKNMFIYSLDWRVSLQFGLHVTCAQRKCPISVYIHQIIHLSIT